MGKIELALKIQTLLNGLLNASEACLSTYREQSKKDMSPELEKFIKEHIEFFEVQNGVVRQISKHFNAFVKECN